MKKSTPEIIESVESSWKSALDSREDLFHFGSNAIALFALGLRFDIEDLESVGVSSIVDGSSDKKNDLIYIEEEMGIAVVIQAYVSKNKKTIAPSNKASDLNTAVTWLLSVPHNDLPSGIKSHALRLREGINSGTIKKLYIWYVHNCTESSNVQEELNAVKITLQNSIKTHYPSNELNYFVNEVGSSTLAEWYDETQSPIAVNEEFKFKCHDGFYVDSDKWNAFVTAIPAKYLFNAYKKHNIKLFSANIRDYLGARVSQSNINNGIVRTISNNPENFWVFNNGLTVLTHNAEFLKRQKQLIIKGIAIVNGAQTTGAIGSINLEPDPLALVPVRFVSVKDGNRDLIHDIVRFNNSQNQVTAADFRSTDSIQRRLRSEVAKGKEAEYEGGRRKEGWIWKCDKKKAKLNAIFYGRSIAGCISW